ncbi:hypothetical protein SUDANB145_05525 [Streptomyces sp. enrichment culture]
MPSSGQSTKVTTASTAHSSADPTNRTMNGGVTAATLIACIAATPRAGGSAASPRMTKAEKPKKTPATSPVPSTPSTVSAKYGPSIMMSAPALRRMSSVPP